jgi:hypothetical protein
MLLVLTQVMLCERSKFSSVTKPSVLCAAAAAGGAGAAAAAQTATLPRCQTTTGC